MIVVSTFNRRDLTGISLDSIKRNKSPCSDVLVIDDASTEYNEPWLNHWGFELLVSQKTVGVGLAAFRRYQEFISRGYAYICALDNDVLLARHFDLEMLKLFCEADDGRMTVVSGYRSVTQKVFAGMSFLRATTINGICQFTSRETAMKILDAMENRWEHPWDRNISEVLSQVIVPKRSLVEHLGVHGTGVNGLSQDVAVDFIGDGK